ncbi:large subunit ribosomal protein L19 [Bartonella sp. AR 15-3]|nr:large subunit ribosomal protein L19 [Bartonella sp. AR 15-3]
MNIIAQLEAEQCAKIEAKRQLPIFQVGDTVRVMVRVTEGTRTRIQAYEGICIARSGGGLNETFTVRKISYGEGVERVFPVYSPLIEGVELVRRGKFVVQSYTTSVVSEGKQRVSLKRESPVKKMKKVPQK